MSSHSDSEMRRIRSFALACFAAFALCGGARGVESSASSGEPLAAAPAETNGAAQRGALFFLNGDQLFGTLQSLDTTNGVKWNHPDATEVIQFDAESIREIQIANSAADISRPSPDCKVRLTNEDELFGNLVSCDADKIILDTWYAGALEIPRKMVRVIIPQLTDRKPLFQGPNGLEGWTIGKVSASVSEPGQWQYRNGAFYATQAASIARHVNLPDLASIQFDLAWKGQFNMAIALYTAYLHPVSLQARETEPDFGAFYSLQLNSYSAGLLPVRKEGALKYLGQSAIHDLSQKVSAKIEIRVNKPKKLIALLVDDVVVKQWIDPDDFAGTGQAIRLVHQGQGAVKVSNLKVFEWDGQFEEPMTNSVPAKSDLTRLRNGDQVNGLVKSISEGKVTCETAGKSIDIPWNRVKQIDFAGDQSGRATPSGRDARAFFSDGGRLTFEIGRWDGAGIVATSPNFGKATFNPRTFGKVLFNLDKTEPSVE